MDTKYINKYHTEDFYQDLEIFEGLHGKYSVEEINDEIAIPVNKVDSIDELKCYMDISDLIFRGHSSPEYELQPTLYRKCLNYFPNETTIARNIDTFKQSLIKEARNEQDKRIHVNPELHLSVSELDKLSIQQLWELGQHYGLNTPLLDWTKNLKKAMYFAFTPENYNRSVQYRAIYILDPQGFNQYGCFKIVESKLRNNNRMINQEGLFSELNPPQSFESLVSQNLNDLKSSFRKLYISNRLKPQIIDLLVKSNINSQTMYTGLEGVIRQCNSLIKTSSVGSCQIKIQQNVKKTSLLSKIKNLINLSKY